MKCPNCGREFDDKRPVCPSCQPPEPATPFPEGPDQQTFVTVVAATPAVQSLLRWVIRDYVGWALLPAFFGLVIIYLGLNDTWQALATTASFAPLGAFFVLTGLALLVALVLRGRKALRDYRETTFLRATGIVKYQGIGSNGDRVYHRLLVDDQSLHFTAQNDESLTATLAHLRSSRVDYTVHTNTVLEIWDDQGYLVYRHPHYHP